MEKWKYKKIFKINKENYNIKGIMVNFLKLKTKDLKRSREKEEERRWKRGEERGEYGVREDRYL